MKKLALFICLLVSLFSFAQRRPLYVSNLTDYDLHFEPRTHDLNDRYPLVYTTLYTVGPYSNMTIVNNSFNGLPFASLPIIPTVSVLLSGTSWSTITKQLAQTTYGPSQKWHEIKLSAGNGDAVVAGYLTYPSRYNDTEYTMTEDERSYKNNATGEFFLNFYDSTSYNDVLQSPTPWGTVLKAVWTEVINPTNGNVSSYIVITEE